MNKTIKENEILTIAGKRVRVEHTGGIVGCFAGCCLVEECGRIQGLLCQGFGLNAYFVPADDTEAELQAEIDKEVKKLHTAPCFDELSNFARHFAEWGRKHLKQ